MSYFSGFRNHSLVVLLLLSFSSYGQNVFDKYLESISVEKQIDTVLKLADYYEEMNQDSALYFLGKAIDLETNNPQRDDSTLFLLLVKIGEINKENQFYEVARVTLPCKYIFTP